MRKCCSLIMEPLTFCTVNGKGAKRKKNNFLGKNKDLTCTGIGKYHKQKWFDGSNGTVLSPPLWVAIGCYGACHTFWILWRNQSCISEGCCAPRQLIVTMGDWDWFHMLIEVGSTRVAPNTRRWTSTLGIFSLNV